MSHLKTINPNWHSTLEFLAGMMEEEELVKLASLLTKSYFLDKKKKRPLKYFEHDDHSYGSNDDDDYDVYISEHVNDLELAAECLSGEIGYGQHKLVDRIINELNAIKRTGYNDFFDKDFSNISTGIIISLLNSSLSAEKKFELLNHHFERMERSPFDRIETSFFPRYRLSERGLKDVAEILEINQKVRTEKISRGKWQGITLYVHQFSPWLMYGLSKSTKVTPAGWDVFQEFGDKILFPERYALSILFNQYLPSEKFMEYLSLRDSNSGYSYELEGVIKQVLRDKNKCLSVSEQIKSKN